MALGCQHRAQVEAAALSCRRGPGPPQAARRVLAHSEDLRDSGQDLKRGPSRVTCQHCAFSLEDLERREEGAKRELLSCTAKSRHGGLPKSC